MPTQASVIEERPYLQQLACRIAERLANPSEMPELWAAYYKEILEVLEAESWDQEEAEHCALLRRLEIQRAQPVPTAGEIVDSYFAFFEKGGAQ